MIGYYMMRFENKPGCEDEHIYFEIAGYCDNEKQISDTLKKIASMIDNGKLKVKSKSVKVERYNSTEIVLDVDKKFSVKYFSLENDPSDFYD